MNTILQSTRRGKLDEETAAAMKKLAKDKMLRALSDQRYASTVYEQEMTQDALLKVVQRNKQRNTRKAVKENGYSVDMGVVRPLCQIQLSDGPQGPDHAGSGTHLSACPGTACP